MPRSAPIEVREERPDDVAAVRALNRAAFGQDEEGAIVDALRSHGGVLLSLVAAAGDDVVGHILYSPVSAGTACVGAGLGPMAVRPEHQGRGIGSRLIETGNRTLERAGYPFIMVIGHPGYYPKFGFQPASAHGIRCEWDVPDEVCMLLVLDRAAMEGISGVVTYRPEYSGIP